MARLPFPDHVRQMLDEPNPAVIATLRADGQPVTVATWYLMDGERVLVNMDEGRKRLDHLRRDAPGERPDRGRALARLGRRARALSHRRPRRGGSLSRR